MPPAHAAISAPEKSNTLLYVAVLVVVAACAVALFHFPAALPPQEATVIPQGAHSPVVESSPSAPAATVPVVDRTVTAPPNPSPAAPRPATDIPVGAETVVPEPEEADPAVAALTKSQREKLRKLSPVALPRYSSTGYRTMQIPQPLMELLTTEWDTRHDSNANWMQLTSLHDQLTEHLQVRHQSVL